VAVATGGDVGLLPQGVVPQWELGDIYKGMMQFMGLQLLRLILIIVFPQIALWLPTYIYGK
jgi:TRAP-type mannitol/chloroaromatic compound transport system permease large subunit